MVIINGFPFLQSLKGHIPDSNGARGDCWDCWPLSMLINLINYVHANPAAQWFRNYICPASFHPHFVGPFCCPPYIPQTFHDYIFAVRTRASIKTINYEVGQRTTDIQMGFRLAYSLCGPTLQARWLRTPPPYQMDCYPFMWSTYLPVRYLRWHCADAVGEYYSRGNCY